jgi:uncharacterized protein (TIGR02596 family)
LLVVITIIAMLLALGTPAVLHSIKASRLTGSGEKLLGALSEAQQTAFSNNQPVEVRFYKFPGALGNDPQFRGYQFFKVAVATGTENAGGAGGGASRAGDEIIKKYGSYNKLPDNVMISADPELSPMLEGDGFQDGNRDAGVQDAVYISVRFMTDGTCRRVTSDGTGLASLTFLGLADSYLTIVEDDGHPYTGSAPPKNFFTVQTDPYTGKSRSYRPGF